MFPNPCCGRRKTLNQSQKQSLPTILTHEIIGNATVMLCILRFTRKKLLFLPLGLQPFEFQQQTTHVFQAFVKHWYDVRTRDSSCGIMAGCVLRYSPLELTVPEIPGFNYITHGSNQEGVLVSAKCERVIGFKCLLDSLRVGWEWSGWGDLEVLRRASALSLKYREEYPHRDVPALRRGMLIFGREMFQLAPLRLRNVGFHKQSPENTTSSLYHCTGCSSENMFNPVAFVSALAVWSHWLYIVELFLWLVTYYTMQWIGQTVCAVKDEFQLWEPNGSFSYFFTYI